MNYLTIETRKCARLTACLTLVVGLLLSSSVSAQQIVAGGAQGQTGSIQKLSQDDGTLTISGQVYAYSDTVTRVLIRDNPVRVEVLTEGMVVRYKLDSSGTLSTLEIIGPADKVRELTSN